MLTADPRSSWQSLQVPSGIGANIQVSVQLALMMPELPCALSNGGSSKLAVPYKKVASGGNGICCWLTPPSPNVLPQIMSSLVVPLFVVNVPGTAPNAPTLYWPAEGII